MKKNFKKPAGAGDKKKVTGGGFQSYNLSPFLFKAIQQKGYSLPTPIQRRAIPIILQGFNVIAMARTGSGKTAAFTIPIVQKLQEHSQVVGARAVILSPTRELAMQSAHYFKMLTKNSDLTHCLIVGGNDMENQFERLLLNPDVIIATPGRLMHCIQQTGLQLSQVQMVVYDEADRLFELGFADQIKSITERMPQNRQSLLFSATISSQVKDFSLSGMKDYRMVQVDRDSKLSDQLKLHFYCVRSGEKDAALFYTLREHVRQDQRTIVFGATKYHVEYLNELCSKAGFQTDYIYGSMDQRTREDRLFRFRKKITRVLFVTDLAARGIDIPLLENVIHYDFPTKMKLFIHRSGRTARAGQSGTSFSLITPEEMGYLHDLSIFVGRKHYDRVDESLKDDPEALKALIEDPTKICYGQLPQHLMDEYNAQVANVWDIHKDFLQPHKKSISNAMPKYSKTKDPASQNSINIMRKITTERPMAIHPTLLDQVDEKEHALLNFKDQLSKFKPKQSVLEVNIQKTQDIDRIGIFQNNLSLQRNRQEEKKMRDANERHAEKVIEQMNRLEERKLIEMETRRQQNDEKLKKAAAAADAAGQPQKRLSKRAQKNLDKALANKNIGELEKQLLIDQANKGITASTNEDGVATMHSTTKRQKLSSYKDEKNFITSQRSNLAAQGDRETEKQNKSGLWDEHERAFLDDVTLNLIPDDEHVNTQGKTVMKWDKIKKRYTLQRVDREGKIIKEKRNESGKKITKANMMNKDPDAIYKRWQQKTHLTLQRSGERENSKLIAQARSANESRAMMKQFRGRHGAELNKGEDVRNPQKLIAAKEKKLQHRMNNLDSDERKSTSRTKEKYSGNREYSQKVKNKIVAGMRPTRSKQIVKTAGRDGGFTGKRGRGGGGGRGGRGGRGRR